MQQRIVLRLQLGAKGNTKTFLEIGSFISTIIYFAVVMAGLYFFIVVRYKTVMARRGATVFGEASPVKTWSACLSDDRPLAATKCRYCGTDLTST